MGAPNASRIETPEGSYTYTETKLSAILKEIDARLNCSDVWDTITRTSGLISKIEIFSNPSRTVKKIERTYTRTTGSDAVEYITGFVTIFYNDDTTEDSRVTTTIYRNSDDQITGCDHVFSTGESECL